MLKFVAEVEGRWEAIETAADVAARRVNAATAELIVADARASIERSESITLTSGLLGRGGATVDREGAALDYALANALSYLPGIRRHVTHRSAQPGEPPHTRGLPGKNLRDAIHYTLTADGDAVIGTDQNMIGPIGEVMEFGEFFRGRQYAQHPFLRPAMSRHLDDFTHNYTDALFDES